MNVYLTNSHFRALFHANVLEILGSTIFNIAFVVYASTLPNAALAISAGSVLMTLPALFGFFTGYLADRTVHRYRWLINVRFIQIAAFLLITLVIAPGNDWWIFGLVLSLKAVSSLIASYTNLLSLPLITRLVAQKDRDAAMSFQQGIVLIINLIGGLGGASLLALLHNDFALFAGLNGFLFILSLGFIITQKSTLKPLDLSNKSPSSTGFWQENINNFKLLRSYRIIFAFTIAATLANFVFSGFDALMNLVILSHHALRFGTYGTSIAVIQTSVMLGMIIGALWQKSPLNRLSLAYLLLLSLLMFGLFSLSILIFDNRYLLLILGVFAGMTIGLMNPKFQVQTMNAIPEDKLAAVNGIDMTLSTLAIPLGQAVFLGAANLISINFALWLTVLFSVGTIVILYYWFKRVDAV